MANAHRRPDHSPPAGGLATRLRAWWRKPVSNWESVLLLAPLLVLYELGVLLQMQCEGGACRWQGNGVDILTRQLVGLTGGSQLAMLGFTVAVALGLVLAVLLARRRGALRLRKFAPVLGESALYAVLVGPACAALSRWASLGGRSGSSWFVDVCNACGAGLYEELVFRGLLFAGGAALLVRAGLRKGLSFGLAAVLSSLAFSAVHHLGALGDPFTVQLFAYRFVMGMLFAAVFRWRGLAIAAWTHALYDVLVFTAQHLHLG